MTPSPARLFRWLLALMAGLFVAAELVLAVGIYAFGWRGPHTTVWTRWLPVPVASLGRHLISAHSFLVQYQAITHYNDQLTATNSSLFPARTAAQNSELAMAKVVRDAALRERLAADHIRLSSADIEQAYQTQLNQTGNPTQIAQTIRQLYDWSPEQFKANVIWTVVAQDKLQEKLSFDPTLNASAKKQADNVLALLQTGQQSFEDVAKGYSDDAYGAQGGDLGFVARGSQLKAIDDAAFELPVGTTSDVIHTKFGFHIIKVIERKTVDAQEEVHLKQIFIAAPSVDAWLTSSLKTRMVWIWLPDLGWAAQRGQAAAHVK